MTGNQSFKTPMDVYLDRFLEIKKKEGENTVMPLMKEAEPKVYNSITLILIDGNRRAFNYGYMTSVGFDALETGNLITMYFTTHKVLLKGYSLLELYEDLVNRYVRTIEQTDEQYVYILEEGTPAVTSVEIQSFH